MTADDDARAAGEAGADHVAALRASYAAQCRAMVAGDADALGRLLADGFTLTHMTGTVQSKEQWLADVRSGEMASPSSPAWLWPRACASPHR
ncbi:nuclear transport factor 2 family protein [Antribacter sp. KLBMP9083]|uniref:Nuclear transport factor 2 family protein n=1 Tax=Antribacter soli TaxID=2910976 RepID=A0AA41QB55_9MICO|nr:nuclear transport factor 2 family protein [Antribacter soli]MCF4119917.1 nuclear transport factor 2 family protein [Antribacter soli]